MQTEHIVDRKLPIILFVCYLIWFVFLGIRPYDRLVWLAENAAVVPIVFFLTYTYRRFQFSQTAYILMSFFIFLHTLGGHFTFERVPFDIVSNLFGFSRNHFDRIAHFTVGLYAYPIMEFVRRKRLTNSRTLTVLFGVFSIFTVASIYEIVEWLYAATAAAEQGIAFLGSQGDIWDAQKDMLADGLGSILATIIYLFTLRTNRGAGTL